MRWMARHRTAGKMTRCGGEATAERKCGRCLTELIEESKAKDGSGR